MKDTKQNIVLKEIYLAKKKRSISEIVESTGLNVGQVYHAIDSLKRRRLIKTQREDRKAGYKIPPMGTLYVEINDMVINRIKDLLK